ncbi:hypothetical protein [Buttiauxella ferragutiae]|uniref:hypothetical protein n=1 Tax=Buttiauxella ferragutiae TaxID=82989 RepID=UPI001F52DEB1|nr:hypothetical protein [Buttiauxella ferragutiae]UNK60703.1 hypothetical protein MNO13_20495 [Buttiauxella ferragutiae]
MVREDVPQGDNNRVLSATLCSRVEAKNDVLESKEYQHGQVASREHKAWRHTTTRINPDSGKPEDEKFVQVVNEHNITWKYAVNGSLVEKRVEQLITAAAQYRNEAMSESNN